MERDDDDEVDGIGSTVQERSLVPFNIFVCEADLYILMLLVS